LGRRAAVVWLALAPAAVAARTSAFAAALELGDLAVLLLDMAPLG